MGVPKKSQKFSDCHMFSVQPKNFWSLVVQAFRCRKILDCTAAAFNACMQCGNMQSWTGQHVRRHCSIWGGENFRGADVGPFS